MTITGPDHRTNTPDRRFLAASALAALGSGAAPIVQICAFSPTCQQVMEKAVSCKGSFMLDGHRASRRPGLWLRARNR
jgi:hypothetical protein